MLQSQTNTTVKYTTINNVSHPTPPHPTLTGCPMSRRRRSRSRDEEDDEDDEVQHGIRRSRDQTTYEYRESSALNPGQIMEQEAYYFAAESWLGFSMNIAEVASGLAVLLAHYMNLSRYQPAVTWITQKILSLKVVLKGISFWIIRLFWHRHP